MVKKLKTTSRHSRRLAVLTSGLQGPVVQRSVLLSVLGVQCLAEASADR